jgi:hypothetical protein
MKLHKGYVTIKTIINIYKDENVFGAIRLIGTTGLTKTHE